MLTLAAIKGVLGLLIGPVAAFFQARETRLTKEADYKERALERQHELAISQQEGENAVRKQVIESDGLVKSAELQAFTASIQSVKPMLPEGTKLTGWQKGLAACVDSFSSLMRPGLTLYYQLAQVGLLIYIISLMDKLAMPLIDAAFAQEISREIIYSIITLAEMSFGWLFGIRMLSTRGKK